MTDGLSAGIVFVALSGLLGFVRLWQQKWALHPELARKALHVGMGAITLAFPWLFESSLSVFLVAVGAMATLVAVRPFSRLKGLGGVLHGVGRKSLGEIYFPVGVAMLFFASGSDPILYWPPLLLLTFADALAALAGVAFGTRHYTTDDGAKTIEGSIAFFAVAFVATALSLRIWGSFDWTLTLLISLLFGLIGVLLEAIAWRGLDNFFIPVLGFLFLDVFLTLGPLDLGSRLILLSALLLFTFLWKRHTTLNDSALVGAALYGYLTLVVGGLLWALPPLLLFLFYPHLIPYRPDSGANDQPAAGVLAVAAPGLFWLLFYRLSGDLSLLFAYNFTFAAHLGIIWVARWLEGDRRLSAQRLLVQAVLSTMLVVVLPLAMGIERSTGLLLYFAAALLATALACHVASRHFSPTHGVEETPPPCWFFRGSLVFSLSLALNLTIVTWRGWHG